MRCSILFHLLVPGGAGLTRASDETYEQSIRPWWKLVGWWREESEPVPFGPQLERFISWMRDERGLSTKTIDARRRRLAAFLRWCADTGRDLAALRPEDLDAYFISSGVQRCSRVS